MRIPIRAIPFVRHAKRLFLGPSSIEDIAFQQEILCPEETAIIPPAVFLPGQIDKVTKQETQVWGQKHKEAAIAEAISTTVTHAATIAYHIKDAVLFDGSIFAGRFKYPIAEDSLFRTQKNEPRHIKAGALASSFLGTKYFGHWLADDCTRYLLAEEIDIPLCVRMPAYEHQQKYQAYFRQDWSPTDRARIDHLVVFQDFSQNSLKQKRYKILRDRLRAYFPQNSGKTFVYLRRGPTGVLRMIQKEDEIMNALTKLGFLIIDVASDSLEDIFKALSNAKMVISLEGSHVAHCTLTVPENGGLLILEPPDRFSGVHRAQAGCLGIRFGFVVGSFGTAGYHFAISEILQTFDLLLNKIEN